MIWCFFGDWCWMVNCGLLLWVGVWRIDELVICCDLQEVDFVVVEIDGEEFVVDCQVQWYGVCCVVVLVIFVVGEVVYFDLIIDQCQCDLLFVG